MKDLNNWRRRKNEMMYAIGWIVTINVIIICITYYRGIWLRTNYLDDCLREEARQFDVKSGEEVDKGYE